MLCGQVLRAWRAWAGADYGGDEDGAWVLLEPVEMAEAAEGAEMAEAADEMADAAFADAAEAEAVAARAEAEAEPAAAVGDV